MCKWMQQSRLYMDCMVFIIYMKSSWFGNIFRITGPLSEEIAAMSKRQKRSKFTKAWNPYRIHQCPIPYRI